MVQCATSPTTRTSVEKKNNARDELVLTLPAISSTSTVPIPSHLAAAHDMPALLSTECCNEQSISALKLDMTCEMEERTVIERVIG